MHWLQVRHTSQCGVADASERPVCEQANDSAAVDKVILSEQELFIQTNASVIRLPMASCSVYGDCERCVNAQDPYCVWNEEVGSCASVFGLR